jgi:hypothetical protein
MSRWKAAAIHCGISFAVVLTIAALMSMTWYPPLLAWAGGQLGIIGILYTVDVTVGPLLTLVVFKTGKPRLKFDLSVIALLQVLGLAYGLHVLYEARQVYLVFAVDSFHVVTAVDIPPENLEKAKATPYAKLPLAGPELIAVHLPQDPNKKFKLTLKTLSGGADIHQYPEYYLPYELIPQEVLGRAWPLDKLLGRDGPTRAKLESWLAQNKREASSVKYLPLYAKVHDLTVLIDSRTAEILDTLAIAPI